MNMVARRVLALVAGYGGGALPAVYLLGRAAGVDLRRYGTGNVGSHNLTAAAGPAAGLAGWLSDAAKGAGAVLLARRLAGADDAAGFALLGALAGQCWPPFLRLHGGRGVATLVGGMLALTPRSAPYALGVVAALAGTRPLGRRLRRGRAGEHGYAVPLGVLAGALAWPVICRLRREPTARGRTALAAALLLLVRRATAGGVPRGATVGPVLVARLLLDRDQWRPAAG